jgi:hypothetical protein
MLRRSFSQEEVITLHASSPVPLLSERRKLARSLAYFVIHMQMNGLFMHLYIHTNWHLKNGTDC